jgi:RNA polymerase sigma factor (sigma-70 family)
MGAMRAEDFEQLYADEAPRLFAFLVYRTGDRALAEDLLADAFERALRGRKRYDPRRGAARTWLYSIALNLLRDHARRAAAEGRALEQVAAGVGGGGDPLGAIDERDAVQRALGELATEEREAVALRFGAELSVPEIARVLGVPLTTAEGRVYRALRKLRPHLS